MPMSILDQIYSYQGSVIDKKHVLDVLGLVDDAFMAELIDALLANDAGKVIRWSIPRWSRVKRPDK